MQKKHPSLGSSEKKKQKQKRQRKETGMNIELCNKTDKQSTNYLSDRHIIQAI